MDDPIFTAIFQLIAELRNRRDVEKNWREFSALVESKRDHVIENFSSRWLISVCDTYADHAENTRSRNALLISLMFNMVRISDTLFEDRDIRPERVLEVKEGWPPFYDGLRALNIDKQDTCLNLAKRLNRALQDDPFLLSIFRELLRRAKLNDNLITRLSQRSAMPEWVFPENALQIADRFGIV